MDNPLPVVEPRPAAPEAAPPRMVELVSTANLAPAKRDLGGLRWSALPPAWRKGLAAGALGLAAAAVAGRNLIIGTPVPMYTAERSDLIQTVVASGRVITPARVSVGSEITGRVARIPVKEGQAVRAGQALVLLDDRNESAAVAQASAAAAQARARLRQLAEVDRPSAEQSLNQARTDASLAARRFKRAQELRAQGLISQSDFDDAQSAQLNAGSRLRAAGLQADATRTGGANEQLAQTALAQAQASLRLAQANLGHTVIRAPGAGTLIARSVEAGDTVQPGRELMALAVNGDTELDVQIDEKNLAQLAPKQKALASADAYPDQKFAAELVYINPGIDALRGSVEVKLSVPNPPAYLRQDMTVSVDIEVARRANALVIPADAVRDAASAQPWVLVVRARRAERQAIRLGLRGEGRVEVLDGLAAGDRVIPAVEGLVVLPGQRVRPAKT